MNEPLEQGLDHILAPHGGDAASPPSSFLRAVAQRRRARRTRQLGTVAALSLIASAAFVAGRVSRPTAMFNPPAIVSHKPERPAPAKAPTLAHLRSLDADAAGTWDNPTFPIDDDAPRRPGPPRLLDRPDSPRARDLLDFN